jgi:hypothetical protein
MIRMHITPYLGGPRLDRLQPEDLEELYNALIEKASPPRRCCAYTASSPAR